MSQKFEGITLNGESLTRDLADEFDSEKTAEIEEVRQEHINLPLSGNHKTYKNPPKKGPRVSKRARHLTDNEIRKEYGIMERPFSSVIENIIWVILNSENRISPKEIAKSINWTGSNQVLSTTISVVYKALNLTRIKHYRTPIILRKKSGNSFLYSSTCEPKDKQNTAYLNKLVKQVRIYQKGLREFSKPSIHDSKPFVPVPTEKTIQAAVEKQLNTKVEISGSIEITVTIK